MLLKEMLGKNIRITTPNKSIFTGNVCEYIFPEDNESGKESIVLKMSNGKLIEFGEMDMKNVDIIS